MRRDLDTDTLVKLKAQLERHEGRRKHPYVDTVGKITIGVGYNLADLGLPEEVIDRLFRSTFAVALDDCLESFSFFPELKPERQAVVVNMAFNLGRTRRLGFRRMIAALERGDFRAAADEMRESRWFRQVGRRGVELAHQMETGEWP